MSGQSKGWGQPRQAVRWRLALICAASLPLGLPGAAVAKEPLEIGMAAALTGYLANFDGQFIDGAKLAAKRANASGGADGHQIELHVLDDGSNATTGVTVTNQLLNQFNVSVMLNGLSSAQNTAIEPILARAKVPQIVFSELPHDSAWAFLANLPHDKVAKLQLQFAKDALHAQKVAILYSQTPYGQVGGKVLGEGAEALGLKIVYSDGVEPSATDMTAQMARIKDAGPDVVIDVLTGSTHIVEAKGAATVGLKVPLLMAGDDTPTYAKVTQAYEATYFVAPPCQAYPSIPDAALKAAYESFLTDYRKTGLDPAELAGASFGWDAVDIVIKAVQMAGATGGDKLHAALETLTMQGANTLYKYTPADHTGQSDVPNVLQIGKMQGDAVVILYPRS